MTQRISFVKAVFLTGLVVTAYLLFSAEQPFGRWVSDYGVHEDFILEKGTLRPSSKTRVKTSPLITADPPSTIMERVSFISQLKHAINSVNTRNNRVFGNPFQGTTENKFKSLSTVPTSKLDARSQQYVETLRKVAYPNNTILLALVDAGFVAMAINFYLTSIKAHGVSNYMILTMHPDTCSKLSPYGINCFMYRNITGAEGASAWGTPIFKAKMNVRTDMIRDALKANLSVLHTDIDMYFQSNPFDNIICQRNNCDIAALMDTSAYNAGFIFINPSLSSRAVYRTMQRIAKRSPQIDDQAQLQSAIKRQQERTDNFHVTGLDTNKFLCGLYYFEQPKRYFADSAKPCPECVVIHNNWIVSMEAKVYRSKELHQWIYDGEDRYYTSKDRLYLSYDNVMGESVDTSIQLYALKHALNIGKLLNRTVVLPKFYSEGEECPLNSLIKIKNFDKYFGGKYREHTFLTHPLVPVSVKSSLLGPFAITTKYIMHKDPSVLTNTSLTRFEPMDAAKGMTAEEILFHFEDVSHSVIHFHSLYGAMIRNNLTKLPASAFTKGVYRQY